MIDILRAMFNIKCPWCVDTGESRFEELWLKAWYARPWRIWALRWDSHVTGRIGTALHRRHA